MRYHSKQSAFFRMQTSVQPGTDGVVVPSGSFTFEMRLTLASSPSHDICKVSNVESLFSPNTMFRTGIDLGAPGCRADVLTTVPSPAPYITAQPS